MQPQVPVAKSGASNRMAFGCLALFALPFAIGGLLALVASIRQYPTRPDAMVGIIVGGIFTVVGLLLLVGAWYARSSSIKTDALQAQNPGKPWMWRDDWAHGSIKDSNKAGAIGMWIFAGLWNAFSFPVAVFMVRQELGKGNPLVLLILLFPLVGVILLITAIYQTLRSMKFGSSVCHLERVPIVPGRTFRGDIQLSTDAVPQNGYQLRLVSIHAVTTRRGKNRSTTENLLWDAQIVVDSSAAMRSPMGTRVPFVFATPPDAHGTDESDSYNRYFWRLSASAAFPGVDYDAQFQLPVFQTGEEVDGSEFAAFEQRHRSEAARHPVGAASGVEITAMPGGGEQFRIHARKTFGATLKSLIVLGIWNAAIVALIHFGAPWIFAAVFILIDAILILSSLDYFLGRSTIAVDTAGVRVRREWLGAGSEKTYEAATIASIDGVTAGTNSPSFGVKLKLKDGSTPAIGSYLPDRESADAVAAKMMADLGRS